MVEKNLQNAILDLLAIHKWLAIRFNSGTTKIENRLFRSYIINGTNKSSGLPDIIAFKNNKFLMIEVKSEKGRLRESQKNFIEYSKLYGVKVIVCNNLKTIEKKLKEIR